MKYMNLKIILEDKKLIIELQNKLDLFQSLRSKKKISKSHYTRRTRKLYNQMSDFADDIHYKLIRYLTMNYHSIFLPTFESQKLIGKMHGKNNRRR